jgi:acyl-CoA thioester hydrolase
MTSVDGSFGVEVWRGGVNTWECDEMGHMNVRFYVARVGEGLAGLAAALGMPQAYAPGAGASLLIREQHIRFLREARAAAPLVMRAAVLSMTETEAEVLQVLFHAQSGEPSATVVSRLSHVTPGDGRPFPWPRQARERAGGLTVALPAYAAPRGLTLEPFESGASLARADELDLRVLAAGAVGPQDCDVFGRMRAEHFIGRVSDGIAGLVGPFRAIVAEHALEPPVHVGGAVLEYRLAYLDWPKAGGRFVIRSGLVGTDGAVQTVVNWMLDPDSGKPWGTSMAVAGVFDLDRRRLVPVTPKARSKLQPFVVPGLAL